jgi:hypothetical protein
MRQIFTAAIAATTFATFAAQAGGYAEPVLEPEVIVEDTSSSSAGILIPILLLVLVAAAASSGGDDEEVLPSDIRLKTDITPVGTAANGLTLYQYRYKGLPTVYQGVMAQDVLAHFPDAAVELPFGYLGVNYSKLGLKMSIVH